MIERYLLRYFLAVIDEGNFSKAAVSCNVAQPTLSVGIAKLEASLGLTLFNRTNRRVELTEAGTSLAQFARRIEAQFLSAEREVKGITAVTTLRLGILTSIPGNWVEDYARQLRLSGSEERVEFVEARERDLLERLTRGRIDVALTILRHDAGRFHRVPLFTEGYSLAISAQHPLAEEKLIDGASLAGCPMIVRRHCEVLSETSRYFTARGVRPFFPARVTNDDHALRLVRAGLGATVMPDSFRTPGVARPRLSDFPHTREIGLLFAAHIDVEAVMAKPTLHLLITTMEALSSE